MVFAFDTLGYAKRLRDTGIPTIEAEAHAEAAREFIMAELATRADLEVTRRELESSIGLLRRDLESSIGLLRRDLESSAGTLRRDLESSAGTLRQHIDSSLAAIHQEMAAMRREVRAAMDNMGLKLPVRLGTMIAVGFGALAALLKL